MARSQAARQLRTGTAPAAVAVTGNAARSVAADSSSLRPEQFGNRSRVLRISYDSAVVIPDGTQLLTIFKGGGYSSGDGLRCG